MTEREAFVEYRSKVWLGRDSDAQLYMELLREGSPRAPSSNAQAAAGGP